MAAMMMSHRNTYDFHEHTNDTLNPQHIKDTSKAANLRMTLSSVHNRQGHFILSFFHTLVFYRKVPTDVRVCDAQELERHCRNAGGDQK